MHVNTNLLLIWLLSLRSKKRAKEACWYLVNPDRWNKHKHVRLHSKCAQMQSYCSCGGALLKRNSYFLSSWNIWISFHISRKDYGNISILPRFRTHTFIMLYNIWFSSSSATGHISSSTLLTQSRKLPNVYFSHIKTSIPSFRTGASQSLVR